MRHRRPASRCLLYVYLLTLLVVPSTTTWARHPKHKHKPLSHAQAPAPAVKPPTAVPTPPAPKPAASADDVEEIEAVEPVTASNKTTTPESSGNRPHSWFEWLARLHAAMVHLPIAWILLLLLSDSAAWLLPKLRPASRAALDCLVPASWYLHGLALLSCGPAILSGLWRFSSLPQDPSTAAPALLHRNVMFATALLLALGLLLRSWQRLQRFAAWRFIYWLSIVLSAALVAWGGHLGGGLVYGEDFLQLPT